MYAIYNLFIVIHLARYTVDERTL